MDEENVQDKRGAEEDVADLFGEEDLVEHSDNHQEDLLEPDEVVVLEEASGEIPVEFAEEGACESVEGPSGRARVHSYAL